MTWWQNKIKGGVGESVCRTHFAAIGYNVEQISIENIASGYAHLANAAKVAPHLQLIKDHIQKLPDFLVSKSVGSSIYASLIETKYRQEVRDFSELETELFWTYRRMIWNTTFRDEALQSKVVTAAEWEDDKLFTKKPDKTERVVGFYKLENKSRSVLKNIKRYHHLPITFYIVAKTVNFHNPTLRKDAAMQKKDVPVPYVYCNYTGEPGWWPAGYERYDQYDHYKGFNQIYRTEIHPALKEIFG